MNESDNQDNDPSGPLNAKEPGFESRVFGIWGNIIRYICGVVSVFTMCYIAYMDAVTVRMSIEHGAGWPSEWHFFIMTVGVTICAMSFSNANKTISTILSTGDLRTRAKNILLSKIGPATPTNNTSNYYWWNAETSSFLTASDSTDLSSAGYIRVPSARPDDVSIWSNTEQTWIAPDTAK